MKQILVVSALLSMGLSMTGCCKRSGTEVWDDTCTATRYMGQGVGTLGGKHGDSRQICNRDEFCRAPVQSYRDEFTPLQDEEGRDMVCMENIQQSPYSPGDKGSPIPGIEAFRDPQKDVMLSAIFENIQFPFDSEKIQGQDNLRKVRTVADYLKKNPNVYVFIEGHCDERGPQAYNLALGTRRANAVRTVLVAEGIDPSRLFTVSYGKERPFVQGHDENAWALNRRSQFKIYER
ncbi:MAG: OmpA family protein [Chlamydiia bacterium]|nr:OmpA family protein [Chlamydiia bacterium]